MSDTFNPQTEAVVELESQPGKRDLRKQWTLGAVRLLSYEANVMTLETDIRSQNNEAEGFLVIADSYDQQWRVIMQDSHTGYRTSEPIYRTDYNLRGIIVPYGKQRITLYNTLLPEIPR